MTFVSRRRSNRRAGRSARNQFRAERRRKILRENWRDSVLIVLFGAGCVVAAVLLGRGIAAFVFAGLAGSIMTLGLVVWIIGGDVHSLPWLWGSIGERQTAEALDGLDDSWRCEQDLGPPR